MPLPSFAVRACGAASVVAIALLLAPVALIAQSPSMSALHDPRDIRITLKARQVLAQDSDLGRLPIYVTVREGNATLWGRVPNEALARRAWRIVEQVSGILQLKSEVVIGPVELANDEAPRLTQSIDVPFREQAHHRQDQRAPGKLAGQERPAPGARAVGAEMGRPVPLRAASPESSAPAILLAPRALESADSLQSAVERVLQSDVRFVGMRCDERAGKITLGGSAARMEHVTDLSRQVARIPGVKEVVVENVRINSR
jgi:hypothetical protein